MNALDTVRSTLGPGWEPAWVLEEAYSDCGFNIERAGFYPSGKERYLWRALSGTQVVSVREAMVLRSQINGRELVLCSRGEYYPAWPPGTSPRGVSAASVSHTPPPPPPPPKPACLLF